jgi:hypothetical protein
VLTGAAFYHQYWHYAYSTRTHTPQSEIRLGPSPVFGENYSDFVHRFFESTFLCLFCPILWILQREKAASLNLIIQ